LLTPLASWRTPSGWRFQQLRSYAASIFVTSTDPALRPSNRAIWSILSCRTRAGAVGGIPRRRRPSPGGLGERRVGRDDRVEHLLLSRPGESLMGRRPCSPTRPPSEAVVTITTAAARHPLSSVGRARESLPYVHGSGGSPLSPSPGASTLMIWPPGKGTCRGINRRRSATGRQRSSRPAIRRSQLGNGELYGEVRVVLAGVVDESQTGDCFSSEVEDLNRSRLASTPIIMRGVEWGVHIVGGAMLGHAPAHADAAGQAEMTRTTEVRAVYGHCRNRSG